MAPVELRSKGAVTGEVENGFIRPSVSPWGATTILIIMDPSKVSYTQRSRPTTVTEIGAASDIDLFHQVPVVFPIYSNASEDRKSYKTAALERPTSIVSRQRIRSFYGLIFGKDYRKLRELVLSLVQDFILKPMVSQRGPKTLNTLETSETSKDMKKVDVWDSLMKNFIRIFKMSFHNGGSVLSVASSGYSFSPVLF
ncbi:hypothetical protein Tco_0017847 [Tanacetum coccineum]